MSQRTDQLKSARLLTPAQVSAKITEGRQQLIRLNQNKVLGQLKNSGEIKKLRRELARLQTILDEQITTAIKEKENA
jgi:ribosomal protein L29